MRLGASSPNGSYTGLRSADCLGFGKEACDRCEPCVLPEGVQEVRWKKVGFGEGGYDMSADYAFVGEGKGAYEREVRTRPGGWRLSTRWVSCACFTVMLIGVTWVFWLILQELLPGVGGGGGGDATATTSQPPSLYAYDCQAGFEQWATSWSSGQQEYCCRVAGRACPAASFDCDDGWDGLGMGWPDDKKAWCCTHYARGCPATETSTVTTTRPPLPTTSTPGPTSWVRVPVPTKFDCSKDAASFLTAWSPEQQAWCCTHAGRGCLQPQSRAEPFNCVAGQELMHLWAAEKSQWCCTHKQVGCQAVPQPAAAGGGGALRGSPTQTFNCDVELASWMTAWGEDKKKWCCQHFSRGCAQVAMTPAPVVPQQAPATSPPASWGAEQFGGPGLSGGCTGTPSVGGGGGLSPVGGCVASPPAAPAAAVSTTPRQVYGCGLPGAVGCAAPALAKVTTTPKTLLHSSGQVYGCGVLPGAVGCAAPAPAIAASTSKLLGYDCHEGLANWSTLWSRSKKDWCCREESLGCSARASALKELQEEADAQAAAEAARAAATQAFAQPAGFTR